MQLYQLIYKSTATDKFKSDKLEEFVSSIASKNADIDVTGCLIFDGNHFLQVLEGQYSKISSLMETIQQDERHRDVVTLLKEPIVSREYANWSMRQIGTDSDRMAKITEEYTSLNEMLESKFEQSSSMSRADMIVKAFVNGEWTTKQNHGLGLIAKTPTKINASKQRIEKSYPHQFALQPIVDVSNMEASCIEFLLRGPNGESPAAVFASMDDEELHAYDVESKMTSLAMAAELNYQGFISINLLPQSLLTIPYAIERISHQAHKLGISPDKVVLEITEQELIDNIEKFLELVNLIRVHGMRLAIDDFGAGYAGLSLLANFQPHKIKIDRAIVDGVASDGPREAIVEAMIHCATRLGIEVIAEGVEQEKDFKWLLAAGITKFQGYYFAKPSLNAITEVDWPEFLIK